MISYTYRDGVRGLEGPLMGPYITCMPPGHMCMHESCAHACLWSAGKRHFPAKPATPRRHAGPAPAPGTGRRMYISIIQAIRCVYMSRISRVRRTGPHERSCAHASRGAQIFKFIFRVLIWICISRLYVFVIVCMRSCNESAGLAKNIGQPVRPPMRTCIHAHML